MARTIRSACQDANTEFLLGYMLDDVLDRPTRIRKVLCTACVASKPQVACLLVLNAKAYLTPEILQRVLNKLSAHDNVEVLNVILPLKLELHRITFCVEALMQAVQVASRSNQTGATIAILAACTRDFPQNVEALHTEAGMCAARGGHTRTVQAVLASVAECTTQQTLPAARRFFGSIARPAQASVLQLLAKWGLKVLGADGIAPYRPLLARRALLGNRPALALQMLRFPGALTEAEQQPGYENSRTAAQFFMKNLGLYGKAVPCAASWAFAQRHLSDFGAHCRVVLRRCASNKQPSLMQFILKTHFAAVELRGDSEFFKLLLLLCVQHNAPASLRAVLRATADPRFEVQARDLELQSLESMCKLVSSACTYDWASVFSILFREIMMQHEQRPQSAAGSASLRQAAASDDYMADSDHVSWLSSISLEIATKQAGECLGRAVALCPCAMLDSFFERLVAAAAAQWTDVRPGSRMFTKQKRFLLAMLRLADRHPGLQALLEARAGSIPWLPLLKACLWYSDASEKEFKSILGLRGVLKGALLAVPGVLLQAAQAYAMRQKARVSELMDFLWDSASPEDRDEGIRVVLGSKLVWYHERCALLDRMSAPAPLGTFSHAQLRAALQAACATGDEAFVQRMVESAAVPGGGLELSSQDFQTQLLIGAANGFGPQTQRIAAMLLRTEPPVLQPQLPSVLQLVEYGCTWGDCTMWLLRAYITAPPAVVLQWTGDKPRPWALPVAVVKRLFVDRNPWSGIFPDLLACSAGRRQQGAILETCLASCTGPSCALATALYRRVQWRGRSQSMLFGRRRILLHRFRARGRTVSGTGHSA
mgnify:CR=1 FL=1